ncbi:MAG: ABC transporter permease [Chloroflexi bacterium]|nr:ABC transporter permease [Chloroflexota bacterium]
MKRLRYILNKLMWALITILIVIVFNFFLFRVLPGDPARSGLKDPRLTQENILAIQARFGLDKPVINCFERLNPIKTGPCLINPLETQFGIYIINLFKGEMGISFYTRQPVSAMIGERLINTVILILPAQLISILLGTLGGIIAAWKSHTTIDAGILITSLITWSVPTFWLGIILLMWGSKFGLPLGGLVTPGGQFENVWGRIVDMGRHILIPCLTFVIIVIGEYVIIMRSTLLDVLSEDYILTAKAKGLNTFQILKDHATKNAMLPMVTITALNLGFTVAGAIQIETVFSYPGVGRAIYEAVSQRDYPLLQFSFLVIAVSVVLANLLAELLYSYLDPRVEVN